VSISANNTAARPTDGITTQKLLSSHSLTGRQFPLESRSTITDDH